MDKTEHFRLNLPGGNDYADVEDLNGNAQKIDAALWEQKQQGDNAGKALEEHEKDTASHLTDKAQTFSGVKTFEESPEVPEPTKPENPIRQKEFDDHTNDKISHVTAQEKETWDAKIDAKDINTANGVAGLNEHGEIQESQIPNRLSKENLLDDVACDLLEISRKSVPNDAFHKLSERTKVSLVMPDRVSGKLYGCDYNGGKLYVFDPNTLSVIKTKSSPSNTATGIGGISNRLYFCGFNDKRCYELDPDTLSVIRSANSPNDSPQGIGGTSNRLYYCDNSTDCLYQLDPNTLSVIKTKSSPSNTPYGIGGIRNRLYHCDWNAERYYELDPDTLSVIKTVRRSNSSPQGIGGTENRLFSFNDRDINELDPNTLSVIKTASSSLNQPYGIGGVKGFTFAPIDKININGEKFTLRTPIEFK